jgi:CubicO group peptidase (beta-lactamase class C family)
MIGRPGSGRPVIAVGAVLTAAALLGLAEPAAGTQAAPTDDLGTRIEAFLSPYVASRNFSGSVLVARDGEPLAEEAFGVSDFERSTPALPDDGYGIGSVSKSFTAAAVLRLAEQGQVNLDDPVAAYLPDFPFGSRVTIRQLLEHRSGLPNLFFLPDYAELAARPYDRPSDVVELARNRPVSEPGATYAYNNLNYTALAWLVEEVAGVDYEAFLDRELLSPLGLRGTGLLGSNAQPVAGVARGHDPVGVDGLQGERRTDRSILVGAGSMYATARDLWQWFDAVADRRLFPTVPDSVVSEYVGGERLVHGQPAIVADGWDGIGYGAHAIYLRAEHLAVVVLSNLNIATVTREIAGGVLSLALGESPEVSAPTARHLRADSLSALAGLYTFGDDFYVPGGTLDIVERDGTLVDESREPAGAIIPLEGGEFLYRPVWATIRFLRDAEGRVTGLTFYDRFEATRE